ncbi:hypothetical protein ACFVY9_09365 [Streptomyces sp. NPDC059544]|uniref:hypothetical protein n=1 Tax=Streptomyces sp. NPDC059544 TaxID=3346861 RepID=UPI0036AA9210
MNDPRLPFRAPLTSPDDGAPLPSPDDGAPPPPPNDDAPPPPPNDGDYSATALASHWSELPDTPPDAVEGTVLRFGPGVTAAARERYEQDRTTAVWHTGTTPGAAPAAAGTGRSRAAGLRRYGLAALILLAALLLLGWQRYGPGPTVRGVAVDTDPAGPGCDGTAGGPGGGGRGGGAGPRTGRGGGHAAPGRPRAPPPPPRAPDRLDPPPRGPRLAAPPHLTADDRPHGRPGTLTYRWVRSDGTASEVLTERLARGQDRARLRLLWTFHGEGVHRARAELRLGSPSEHHASTEFTYTCP